MSKDIQTQTHLKRLEKLLRERKKILAMEGDKALEAILDMPDALPLVHSFSEEDLFFLINDIGLDDALPILAMATTKQWEYIIDTEIWEQDRMNVVPVLKWFDLLQKADSDRFIKWLKDEKVTFLEFCLFKNIEVRIREHDEDPSTFGDDFFTIDDVYYIRFIDYPFAPLLDDTNKENRDIILTGFLKGLAETDYLKFQHILFETSSIIPAETEEELYRLRNVRLAEKGFLPFDEAVGIYQPLASWEKKSLQAKSIPASKEEQRFAPISLYPSMMLEEDNTLAIALGAVESDSLLLEFQTEFAALCNQIIAADQRIIHEREELQEIVKKACGYISIGLQQILDKDEIPQPYLLSELIQTYPLGQLFRTGYGLALELKLRAERFQEKSFFAKHDQPLSFWGEKGLGVLGGLLVKRPLYFDNYNTGSLYREFNSLKDIKRTEKKLSHIIAFDELLSCLPIAPIFQEGHFLTYKNFLLTLWARDHLALIEEFAPIPLERFRIFFEALFNRKASLDQKNVASGKSNTEESKIGIPMKAAFLKWLSTKAALSETEITEKLSHAIEDLFDEIEGEYGEILIKDLDPRYIYLFLLEQDYE